MAQAPSIPLRLAFASFLLALASASCVQAADGKPQAGRLRVGVFDSRAVAVAYTASKPHNQEMQHLMAEHRRAKETGDQAKVKRLEAEGEARQHELHLQGFGTASVANILQRIKEQLPTIAKENGVEIIVSKWDIAYQASPAETVDITEAVIKPFEPSERTLKIVKELKGMAPIPAEKLRNLRCE